MNLCPGPTGFRLRQVLHQAYSQAVQYGTTVLVGISAEKTPKQAESSCTNSE